MDAKYDAQASEKLADKELEEIKEGKLDIGRNMLNEGFSIETIMKITNLTNEQINSSIWYMCCFWKNI